jgi:hypothetical protein
VSKAIKPKKVMTTLGDLWIGKRCPHENECACRKGRWCPEAETKLSNGEPDYPMLHLAGCSFAYDRCCCRVLEEIEILAGEYLRQGGVKQTPVPLDLISLFDSRRSVEIRYLPLKQYLGCTWFFDEEWIVHVNANAPPEVRHFTAFHEGFHIICGSSGLVFRRRGNAHQAVSERLADYFAASILMPRDFVYGLWPEVEDVAKMARIFTVPEPVMKDWLVRLSVVTT